MGAFRQADDSINWMTPMLNDESKCGPDCTPEGWCQDPKTSNNSLLREMTAKHGEFTCLIDPTVCHYKAVVDARALTDNMGTSE